MVEMAALVECVLQSLLQSHAITITHTRIWLPALVLFVPIPIPILTPTLTVRLMDAVVYFWMPQIACIFLRLVQGRNILHRMVGRTVVIGDIPWVAQAGEAFLSKVSSFMRSVDMDMVSVDSMRRKIGVRSLSFFHALRLMLHEPTRITRIHTHIYVYTTDVCLLVQYCRLERPEWQSC